MKAFRREQGDWQEIPTRAEASKRTPLPGPNGRTQATDPSGSLPTRAARGEGERWERCWWHRQITPSHRVPSSPEILGTLWRASLPGVYGVLFATGMLAAAELPVKQHAAFYTPEHLAQIRANARKDPWAIKLRDDVLAEIDPWMKLSDAELWELMFGATIPRSWMVWSNGHCPACKKPVEMYSWKMEAWKQPWKTRCPNCQELFPKNDFYAFYRSGLDEHGVFDPKLANRTLLFNSDHPDPDDPLHLFGVDDGGGYVEAGQRWRFIGAYLIFGQFHQRVLAGIKKLSAAYVLSGDQRYAHKAAVLLDRVADLYPSFNFASQGFVYEVGNHNGYVSVWHDACEETYDLTLAYDQIFEGLHHDPSLLEFLSAQATKYKLPNSKKTIADVQRNIEGGILRDALAHKEKIHSNFPRRECSIAMIETILGWPENRKAVEKMMDAFIAPATAVDGVTGEKGLAGYTAYTIAAMGRFFGEYSRSDLNFLHELLQRNPRLRETYRFHIDTHCLQRYYPLSGDTGSFAQPIPKYAVGLVYSFRPASQTPLIPSLHAFLWQLYRETGDAAYVQTLYSENEGSTKDLPYNLFEGDSKAVQKEVATDIVREGAAPKLRSLNKEQWHLAILRSGKGEDERAVWLDYDAGGGHGHLDGMNLGMFAHGLDLLPEFGYPLVQFGGWYTPRANWYKMTAAHNTVVIDGQNQVDGAGKTTLWADGFSFHAIRASGPAFANAKQFERTVSLVDVSDRDFYVVDVFRIIGGADHAKFIHGYFGTIKSEGLTFSKTNDFGNGTQTRNFQTDPHPQAGWSITWECEDRLKLLPNGKELQMHYSDFTTGAEAMAGEAWVVPSGREETWNPCVITRHRGPAPLSSTFVGVIEGFSGKSCIAHARRLPLVTPGGIPLGDAYVALEITLRDGRRDLFIAADAENPAHPAPASDGILVQPDWNIRLDGQLCWIRKRAKGNLERVAFAKSRSLQIGGRKFENKDNSQFTETVLKN